MEVAVETTAADAARWLASNHPAAIALDVRAGAGGDVLTGLRYDPGLANVPILALADRVSDLHFEEVFGWGGDDVTVATDDEALARRLRTLALAGEIPTSKPHGTAVVADADRRWRVLTARALRNAGWSVSFAADAGAAIEESRRDGVELVVSTAALGPTNGAETLVAEARAAGVKVPWVVAAPPKEMPRLRGATRTVSAVAVYDSFGPTENVLFVANELLRKGGSNARKSARLLYGTAVEFRAAGSSEHEVGYSYNLSAGGLYVRTLAPLARGAEVWLELAPPRSDRRVRLEAKVVWTRGFGPNDSATIPPGFGVQITGGSVGDLERYARGYQTFAAELAA
jgi:DNA-binding response OmpR family regulator/Tfp pilus assembly protein PilZ